MFHINTVPGQAAKQKGFARYPEDFPHLAPGEDFSAWRSGDDWEIETTLVDKELIAQIGKFMEKHKHDIRMWEVKYQRQDGEIDFLWYGNHVDEAEAERRNQDLSKCGLTVLSMRAIYKLPTNPEYRKMLEQSSQEVKRERN